ncbi:ABC-F family ATP-binding cassette domain-containing protein [Arthrobacter globiformis]|uniref:ABC transporter ATP-binding protein n=1 Tax=Arthrobacter globiformis TaxID=1665 RepID=A0A328HNQ1_ARTGO|nr:ABC-F family ATP-binding cassette domain-containing protein [Arthrobacter globiformis]RAM38780.1 ABC transporter ATP-binding protein [Arthrobacter globiformis]
MTEPNFRTEQLRLSGVSHGYGDRELFTGVDLAIAAGEHAAVVGENGAGKSTLLRILAGIEAPAGGTVRRHGRVGYLAQTSGLPARLTVADAIDNALLALREMESELERLEDGLAAAGANELEAYGNLQTQYQLREGYAAESRVEAALDRLGLGGVDRRRALGSLSGGEQERVALACLLADPADILLLDEPTNHLDAGGTAWLEGRLAAHRGPVVVVSHDRVLLRKIAAAVIEVDAERRTVNRYGNGYDGYLKEKRAERQRWAQQYHGWLDAMASERRQADTVADRMGYARRRDNDKAAFDFKTGTWQSAAASKVRNAQERLRRLEGNPVERPPERLKLDAGLDGDGLNGDGPDLDSGPRDAADRVLYARNTRVPGRLDVPEFRVDRGQKVLITGPNGAGKSTLLSVLAGTLEPAAGQVVRRGRIGYLQQELELPEQPSLRLLPAFAAGLGGNIDDHAEALLRLGLFRTSEFHVPVGALSAGQQRRLSLARLLLGRNEVMLLDEPTNHLAPVLVEELESALADFSGTVVMVSHDRALGEWFDGCADRSRGRAGEGTPGTWLRYTMAEGTVEKVALPA